MKTGNDFYDKLPKEEQEQYTILFEDKSGWYTEDGNGEKDWSGSEDKIKQFDESCNKFIKLQNNPIYLSFLHFPSVDIKNYNFEKNREIIFCNSIFYGEIDFHSGFTKYIQETNFENAIFKEKVDFGEYTFGHKISFKSTTFKKDVNFKLSNFTRYINFRSTTFNKDVNFDEANFENKVSFWGAIFADEAHFDSTVFKQAFNFTKTQITNITFVNSDIKNGNFLYISAYNKDNPKNPKPLTKGNLKNKESARLIKDHFEKQNNIIEANKYFRIEQDKYLEELINDGYWKNKGDIAVVFLNKIISNHQTSWLRVLLILCIYAFIVFAGYEYFKDFSTLKQGFLASLNKAVELIDPLNMFKRDNNLFENHQALGFAIRIFSLYLFWQFITAFRQNTRRK